MIQFQENIQTDGWMEEQTDTISERPSSCCLESNKYNCNRLEVKDTEYDVGLTKNYHITFSV